MLTEVSYPQQAGDAIKFVYSLREEEAVAMDQVHRRLPDGTLDLVFNLGDPVYSSRDGITYERLPDVVLAGLYPDRNFVRYTGAVHLVVAVLQPGAAHLFVKDRLEIFRESAGDAALIWGRAVYDVLDQLHALNTPATVAPLTIPATFTTLPTQPDVFPDHGDNANQQHALVEQFLVQQLHRPHLIRRHPNKDMLSRILHTVREIDYKQGDVSLPNLYRGVYMSERDFRRKFTDWVGMSPKQYAGIIRVKAFSKRFAAPPTAASSRSLHAPPLLTILRSGTSQSSGPSNPCQLSQTDLAADLGYTDASHFRRDFQKIAGLSPAGYFGQLGNMGKRFMEIM